MGIPPNHPVVLVLEPMVTWGCFILRNSISFFFDCVTVVTSQVYPMVRDIFPLDNSCSADPMTLPTIALQQTSMIMEGSKI